MAFWFSRESTLGRLTKLSIQIAGPAKYVFSSHKNFHYYQFCKQISGFQANLCWPDCCREHGKPKEMSLENKIPFPNHKNTVQNYYVWVRGEWHPSNCDWMGMLAVETFCACVMLLGRQQSNRLAILLECLLFCLLLERGVCRPLLRGMLIFQKHIFHFFETDKRTDGPFGTWKTIGSKCLALCCWFCWQHYNLLHSPAKAHRLPWLIREAKHWSDLSSIL